MATIFRAPLIERKQLPSRVPFDTSVPNLLISTLNGKDQFFGGAGQPPAQLDRDSTRYRFTGTRREIWYDHPPNLSVTTLLNQDKFFGAAGQPVANFDHNATTARFTGTRRYIWFDQPPDLLLTTLKSKDQFFGAAGQPPANFDHNSTLYYFTGTRRYVWYDHPPNLLVTELKGQDQFFGAAGQPPVNLDLQLLKQRRLIVRDDWPSLLVTTLAKPFFSQLDAELRRPRRSFDEDFLNLLTTTLAVTSIPFFGSIDPFFAKRLSNVRVDEPLNLLVTTLRGQDQFFGAPGQVPTQIDWSLQRQARRLFPESDLNLLVTTLAKPFFGQLDTEPRRLRRVSSDDHVNLLLTAQVPPFFGRMDNVLWTRPQIRPDDFPNVLIRVPTDLPFFGNVGSLDLLLRSTRQRIFIENIGTAHLFAAPVRCDVYLAEVVVNAIGLVELVVTGVQFSETPVTSVVMTETIVTASPQVETTGTNIALLESTRG